MKADIKRIEKLYQNNINEMPISDLEKIVYNKNFDFMISDLEDSESYGNSLKSILGSVEYNKRLRLFGQLYSSSINSVIVNKELTYRKRMIDCFLHIIVELMEFETSKVCYDYLQDYKRTKDINYLDSLEEYLQDDINRKSKELKSYTKFKVIHSILNGEKEEIEFFHDKEELELFKKFTPEAYDLIVNKSVLEKSIFDTIDHDNFKEYLMAIIKDLLNNDHLNKVDGVYRDPETNLYKFLSKELKEKSVV